MLNKEELFCFNELISKATRSELEVLKKDLDKEIRLSKTAIKEGFEKC